MLVRAVKFLIICFFALAPVVFLIATGCATHPPASDPTKVDRAQLERCLQDQVDYYGDLCAEAQGVALNYRDEEAFFYGMLCGIQGVAICADVEQPKE